MEFDFVITYRPGAQQGKADALSRRSEYQPKPGDLAFEQQKMALLKPNQLKLSALIETPSDNSLLVRIREQLSTDPLGMDVMLHLSANPPDSPPMRQDYTQFSLNKGLVFRDGLLYVPDIPSCLDVLHSRHDSNIVGHVGIAKTFELVS